MFKFLKWLMVYAMSEGLSDESISKITKAKSTPLLLVQMHGGGASHLYQLKTNAKNYCNDLVAVLEKTMDRAGVLQLLSDAVENI